MPAMADADQLKCNEQFVAEAAASMLAEGAIILDFCSNCEDQVRVVRVISAAAVEDCDWELEVAGRVVWESELVYKDGYEPRYARFRRDGSRYLRRLDLAYVYGEVAPNEFQWIGGQLSLEAQVKTATIRLPKVVSIALGKRPLMRAPSLRAPVAPPDAETPGVVKDGRSGASGAEREDAGEDSGRAAPKREGADAAPPSVAAEGGVTPAEVAAVFDHWRKGDGPVLAHFAACLELDLKKGSPTRYECVSYVEGPVAPGTQVFAWTDWLVPRGKSFDSFAIEYVYDGEVRLRKPFELQGRKSSPIVPKTIGAALSQQGIYTLRLTEGRRVLRELPVEVR